MAAKTTRKAAPALTANNHDPIRPQLSDLIYLIGFTDAELDPLMDICLRNAKANILTDINQEEMPAGLHNACACRAAGEYLRIKLDSGTLTAGQLDALQPEAMEYAVKQIKEGEVSTTFAVGDSKDPRESALARLAALAKWLANYGAEMLPAHRRMRW